MTSLRPENFPHQYRPVKGDQHPAYGCAGKAARRLRLREGQQLALISRLEHGADPAGVPSKPIFNRFRFEQLRDELNALWEMEPRARGYAFEKYLKTLFDTFRLRGRRVAPPEPVPDHEDYTADDPAIIDARHTMRKGKVWLDPAHLRLRQPDQITHDSPSSRCH